MSKVVFDASALIALLRNEDGRETAERHLAGAVMSSINFGEVIRKCVELGESAQATMDAILPLQIEFVDHDLRQAFDAGSLRSATRSQRLSYADCACLALGMIRNVPILTTDEKWLKCRLSADIRYIRSRPVEMVKRGVPCRKQER